MGEYVVSPTTHAAGGGRFSAAFAIKRADGNGTYCRVFRFDRTFASRHAAQLFAVTQGWIESTGESQLAR